MSKEQTPAPASPKPEIDAFLEQVRSLGPAVSAGKRGRLIFALDATMSRQPTWDTACALQADMFREAASVGGLDIQLVYFRGLTECRASSWVAAGDKLAALMGRIDCRGGHTQIGKVLDHARREHAETAACRRWSSSATPWRRRSTTSASPPASLACAACRCSCSRRAMTRWPNRPIARSRGCRAAPIAASTSAPRISWASCCGRWPPMPPAAARRLPNCRRGAPARRTDAAGAA